MDAAREPVRTGAEHHDEAVARHPDEPAAHVVWAIVGIFGAVGYVLGSVILRVGARGTPRARSYLNMSETQVHLTLLAGEVAFWFIVAPLLISWRRHVARRFRVSTNRGWFLLSIAAFAAVIFVPLHVESARRGAPIPGYSWRIGSLYLVALVMFVPALQLLDTIDAGCRDAEQSPGSKEFIQEYFKLRAALRRVTTVLGVSVSLVVLATGAYINALRAYHDKVDVTRDVPPQGGLVVYGALFVAVLIALFLPVHTSVRRRGDDIVDAYAELPDTNNGDLAATLDRRDKLRSALGLDESGRSVLERNVIVLSPLLSAAIATFLGSR